MPARPIQRIRSSSLPVLEARAPRVELPAPPGEAPSNEPVKQRPAHQARPNGGHYRVRQRGPERIPESGGEGAPNENARSENCGREHDVARGNRNAGRRERENRGRRDRDGEQEDRQDEEERSPEPAVDPGDVLREPVP